jgi:hypothetical protein
MNRKFDRKKSILVLGVLLAVAIPISLASTVTLTPGTEILQPGNDAVFQVEEEFNTSTLTVYDDAANFGGVNFSVPHTSSVNATINISEFNADAVQDEVVADFKANATSGDSVTFDFSNLTSRRYYQLYLDGLGLRNITTGENGDYSYTIDYNNQGFKNFELKALVRDSLSLSSSLSGGLNYKANESYTVSGSADYSVSGDAVQNTDVDYLEDGNVLSTQQTDSSGQYSFSLNAPKEAGSHTFNTTISKYGMTDSVTKDITVTSLFIEDPNVTSVETNDRYIDIDDKNALNLSATVYRNTDNPIESVTYNVYEPGTETPVMEFFKEWSDLENTTKKTQTQLWYNTTPRLSNFDIDLGNYTVRFDATSTIDDGTADGKEIHVPLDERPAFNFSVQDFDIELNTDQKSYSANSGDDFVNITGRVIREPTQEPVGNEKVYLKFENKSSGSSLTYEVTTNSTGYYTKDYAFSTEPGVRVITATSEDDRGINGKTETEFTVTQLSVDGIGFTDFVEPWVDYSESKHMYNVSAEVSDSRGIDGSSGHTCTLNVTDGSGNYNVTTMDIDIGYGNSNQARCSQPYISYKNNSAWSPTEELTATVRVENGSDAYAEDSSVRSLPNAKPTIDLFYTDSVEDRYAFDVIATANDPNEGADELESCNVYYYGEDGTQYERAGSLNTDYPTAPSEDWARCTYEINTSLPGVNQQDSIDVEVGFVDKHGAETISNRKTAAVEASLSFSATVATLDGIGHDTTIEFQEPGTSNVVQTMSDSNGEISGSISKGYYDVVFHTIGQELELRNASIQTDKDLDFDLDPDAGNKFDENLSQQYVREFTFFTASHVGLDYEDAVIRFNYNGHNEKYLKPWVCETWNEEVEYRECRQDQFPFDKLSYNPAETYEVDSSNKQMIITSNEIEGAYIAAENRGWREGWFQRSELTVTGGNEPLEDYQIKLSFDTKSRILNNTLDSDCGSIRFYDTDQQNQLDYWMEPGTCNTEETEFWVELPYIPSNADKAIFLYYGDKNLDSQSSGDETFIEFDEFDGSSLSSSYDSGGDYEVQDSQLELASQESDETSVTFRGSTVSAPYRTHARIYREDASEEAVLSTQIDSSWANSLSYNVNQGLFEETYTGALTSGAAPSDNWIEVNQSVTSSSQQVNVRPSGDSLSLSADIPASSYSPFGVNVTEDSEQISTMRVERWFTTNYADSEPSITERKESKQWSLSFNNTEDDINIGWERVVDIYVNSSENPSDISLYIDGNLKADGDNIEGLFYRADNLDENRSYSIRAEIEKFGTNITNSIIMGQDDKSPIISLTGKNRLGTNEMNFTYDVEDNYQGSLECRLDIEDSTYATSLVDIPLGNETYSDYFHITDAPHGDNQYSVYCEDQSGNSNIKTSSYSQDFQAPEVQINAPYSGKDLWQVRPEVNFTLTDDFDADISYEVYYESSPGNSVTGTALNDTKETVTMPVPDSYGTKDVIVKATDNRSYSSTSSVTVDLHEPEVTLKNPPTGSEETRVIHDTSKSGDERTIPGDRYELDGDTADFRFNYTNYALDSTTCRLMIDGSEKNSSTFQTNTVEEFTDVHVNDGISNDWIVECQTSTGSYVSSSPRQISVDTVEPGIESVRFIQGNGTAYAEGLSHQVRVKTTDNLETPATSKELTWAIDPTDCVGGSKGSTSTDANPYLEINGQDNNLVMKHNFTQAYSNETVSLEMEDYRVKSGCLNTVTKTEPTHYAQESFGSLEPGQYNFKYWISDELGNTYESQEFIYEVVKGDPGLSISSDNERAGDNTIVQDTSPQIRCSGVTDQVSTELKRNGLIVDSSSDGTTTLNDNSDLPTGTYNYNCSSGGTNNYSADYVTRTIEVVDSVEDEVEVIVNGNSSIPTLTYGAEPTIESTSRSGTEFVYVDGVNVTEPYTKKLAAGTYDLKANSTGTYRFDPSNDTETLTVQKATPSMSLSSNASFDVARGVMAELTCQSGSDEGTMNLDRNGTQVASGTTPITTLVNTSELGTGYYGYSCDIGSSENYTSNSKSKVMQVYTAPAPTFKDGGSGDGDSEDGVYSGGDDGTVNDGFDFSGSSVERDLVRGTTVNVTCDTQEEDVDTTLYHDSTEVSSPFVTTYDVTANHELECVAESTTDTRSVTKTINYDVMNRTTTKLYFNGGRNDIIVDQDENVEIVGEVNYSGTTVNLKDLKIDSTIWRDDDGKANTTRSFDVVGSHTIKAVHPEEDDYFASSDNLSIVVEDITAPRISLDYPQEGEIIDYYNDYSIDFTARDYSAYTCNAIVNGSTVRSDSRDDDDNLATDGFYFNPSAGSGVYEYRISCNDEFGNQRNTEKVQFRLDHNAPSLTFNDPQEIQTGDPSPELSVTTDDDASRQVTVELYKGAELDNGYLQGGEKIGEKTIAEGDTDQIQIDPQPPGVYDISAEVTDEVEHDTVYHDVRQVNISDDVILMDPESSSTQRYYTPDQTPTLNFTYYSDTAPMDCDLEVDGNHNKTYNDLNEGTEKSYTAGDDINGLSNGKHNWTVTCSSVSSEETFSNTAEFWVDTQEPGVDSTYISRPSGSSYTGDPITYSIEADEEFELENATFTYASDLNTKLMDCNEQNVCTTSVNLDTGEHHYNYTLCDKAGNCYTTDTSSYTVTSKENSMNLYLNDQEDNITITDNPVVNVTGEFISPKSGTVYFYVNNSITGRCDRGDGCTIESRFLENGTYKVTAEFYDYAESTTDVDTYWVNAQVPETTIQSFGYEIYNLPRGNASLRSNPAFSVLANGVKDLRNVLLGEKLGEELAAQLKFDFTSDIDGSDIDFQADRDLRKSFVHLKRDYSQLKEKTLLVPRKYDTGQVQVCPGAESLKQVNSTCSGGYNISTGEQIGSVTMEEVSINSQDYYELSGIQGTGGQEVVEDQWNNEPAGAQISDVETFDEYEDIQAPDTLNTEGGKVTHADLTGKQSTDDWSGIFGNASGNINLGTEAMLYSWPARANLIFVANHTVSWNQLEAANLSDVDSYYGLDGSDDANNTFINETDVELERVTLSNVSSTKTYNGSEIPTWKTGALSDGENPLFVGMVRNNDSTAFNGEIADYQMIVPVSNDRLIPYSIYMDLK